MKDYTLPAIPCITVHSLVQYLNEYFQRNALPWRAMTDEANKLTVIVYPDTTNPIAPVELQNYVDHLLGGMSLQPEIRYADAME